MSKDYFKVLLVGSSGKGKTFTLRNLDKSKTGYINTENKPLPFKGNFKYHTRPTNYTETIKSLVDFAKNSEVEVIVIDSFSAFTDSVLLEARKTKKGFDVWTMYNDELGKILDLIKRIPKTIFVTAHYESIGNADGNSEKTVKVKANEWKNQVEKEFTVVLFADSKLDSKTQKPEYYYNLWQEGTTAKCPPELFGDTLKIENDANLMLKYINEFYKVPELTK